MQDVKPCVVWFLWTKVSLKTQMFTSDQNRLQSAYLCHCLEYPSYTQYRLKIPIDRKPSAPKAQP